MSLNFDNAMYQAIAIFEKRSGFLEWELISSNSERINRLIALKQYQKTLTGDSRCIV